MSFLGLQYPDGAVFFSGSVTTAGPSAAFNTTGYDSLVLQVSGAVWAGIITIEGSNDGNTWSPVLVTKLSELAVKTQIDLNGNWLVKADPLYIRYNVTNITGTITLVIIGNNNVVSNPVDRLSLAMDPINNTPLYVNVTNQLTQSIDNTPLFIGEVGAVGPGTPIDTTGYSSVSIQAASTAGASFGAIATIEMSNDTVNWQPALVTQMDTMQLREQIDIMGTYVVKSVNRYIRYNIQNITNAILFNILGKTSPGPSGADSLSLAMDPQNQTPLYTAPMPGTTRQDTSGALIPSDSAIATPTPTLLVTTAVPITIDTTGYQTVSITTGTFAGTISGSNDGVTFTTITGYSLSTNLTLTAMVATSNYVFPITQRFLRFTATTSGTLTYYLRQQPFSNPNVNVQQIAGATTTAGSAQIGINLLNLAGTGLVTGGVAGTLGIGSAAAVGVAPTSNPLLAGGSDPSGLTRRLSSDPLGGLNIANRVLLSSNAAINIGGTITGQTPIGQSSFVNQMPLNVQDSSNFEGQLRDEILAQILQELKILNQQIYELPRVQMNAFNGSPGAVNAQTATLGDEPGAFRNDASIFGQQQ